MTEQVDQIETTEMVLSQHVGTYRAFLRAGNLPEAMAEAKKISIIGSLLEEVVWNRMIAEHNAKET